METLTLIEEIIVELQAYSPKHLSKDRYFKDHQNLTGSALPAVASVLIMILSYNEVEIDRDYALQTQLFLDLTKARITFIYGRYNDKICIKIKKSRSNDYSVSCITSQKM